MLKKSILVVAVLLAATNLWAVQGPMDVSRTRHNLSSSLTAADKDNMSGSNYYVSSNEDEVCIFCHTPHGGTMNTPLWNRALPIATGFTHYSSATLTTYLKDLSARVVRPESLLCMSCHDGQTAVASIVNNSNRTIGINGGQPNSTANLVPIMSFTTGGAIGAIIKDGTITTETQNLSDDHPISFSYSSSQSQKSTALRSLAAAKLLGVRFFGPDIATGNFVECSSCHDPHVNYTTLNGGDAAYTPFLITPNTGSALCLACHIK